MWYGPLVISKVLEKGAYELIEYDGIPLGQPRNGLYLKRYFPRSLLVSIWYICILLDFQCALSIFNMFLSLVFVSVYTMFWSCRADGFLWLQ